MKSTQKDQNNPERLNCLILRLNISYSNQQYGMDMKINI